MGNSLIHIDEKGNIKSLFGDLVLNAKELINKKEGFFLVDKTGEMTLIAKSEITQAIGR